MNAKTLDRCLVMLYEVKVIAGVAEIVRIWKTAWWKLYLWFICGDRIFFVLSLLGLLAKIMCSICSCQLNIWHGRHRLPPILNWFLIQGLGKKACFSRTTDCPGLTLPPGTVQSTILNSIPPQLDLNRDPWSWNVEWCFAFLLNRLMKFVFGFSCLQYSWFFLFLIFFFQYRPYVRLFDSTTSLFRIEDSSWGIRSVH